MRMRHMGTAGSTEAAYASVSSRLLAFLVDAVLLTALLYIGSLALSAFRGPVVGFQPMPETGGSRVSVDQGRALADAVVNAALSALYFIAAWAAASATPGQRLLGIGVRRVDGRSLTIGQAFIRWVVLMGPISLGAVIISARPGMRAPLDVASLVWYLLILVTAARSSTRQGLHDRLSGSIVTRGARLGHRVATS